MNTSSTTNSTKKLIMWYKIEELFSKGQSYSQISRNLGIDRHRVSHYAHMSEEDFLSSEAYCRSYTHKMDAYEDFVLNELRSCPSYSSKQIEDHLKETYGDAVNDICSKTIFNYVVHIRAKYSIPKFEKPPRPYEKLPELPFGEYGQVDFGEYWMRRFDGRHLKVYFFVMVLSRSRYKYVYFSTKPFNTAMTVYAHELAFSHYGGRPKKLLYDQDKVLLYDENLGDLILTKGFRTFVDQVKGALIQETHKTVRGVGITNKEQEIHGYIGDIEALDLFLAGISQSKPAYYSRNLSYIIQQMYAYKPEVLHLEMMFKLHN